MLFMSTFIDNLQWSRTSIHRWWFEGKYNLIEFYFMTNESTHVVDIQNMNKTTTIVDIKVFIFWKKYT